MNILLIEDNDSDIQVFTKSVKAWKAENPTITESVDVEPCKTLDEAMSRTSRPDNSDDWDGIVLDLKLPQDTDGESFLTHLKELYSRIPVVVLSGTPWELDDEYKSTCLKSYVKAEQHEKEILDLLWDCKRTGLMNLIGGKGLVEKYLKTVFDKCIVPRFDEWRALLKRFGVNDAERDTQAALSRHVLCCLQTMMQQDVLKIQPEECYLTLTDEACSCPIPGMILQNNENFWYLVLNPACDLAVRDGGSVNSTVMLLVSIDPEEEVLKLQMQSPEQGRQLSNRMRDHNIHIREEAFKNNGPIRFHWLPECGGFNGGFVNFRKVITTDRSKFGSEYVVIESKFVVHPEILKNIQSRFANYYARQGQPDIDYSRFSSKPVEGFI